jgi:hypothetical protein
VTPDLATGLRRTVNHDDAQAPSGREDSRGDPRRPCSDHQDVRDYGTPMIQIMASAANQAGLRHVSIAV